MILCVVHYSIIIFLLKCYADGATTKIKQTRTVKSPLFFSPIMSTKAWADTLARLLFLGQIGPVSNRD